MNSVLKSFVELRKGVIFMVENDVVLNKVETIERCIIRVREVYANDPNNSPDFNRVQGIAKAIRGR